jgi:ribosomal peptide maturation radical SAM protein 1
MLNISLINMPFASLRLPSLGLTQLKAVLEKRFAEKISVRLHYINQDFGGYIGVNAYEFVANTGEAHNSGLGDWFFRQVAFPEVPDNADDYFRRYFPQHSEQNRMYRRLVEERRRGLEVFLDGLIDQYHLDQADILGFTSMFSQNVASFAMARKVKSRNPDVHIVIGGANCEAPMGAEIVKNVDYIDFAFSGPALKSFSEFVESHLNVVPERFHMIRGVLSKKNCTEPATQMISTTLARDVTMGDEFDINNSIELDYDSFLKSFEKRFPRKELTPVVLFETSRGCWWGEKSHCTFCGLNGATMAYRAMSPQNAINQFKSLFKYASQSSIFQCVDNIMPKSYLKEVFPSLDPPNNVSIFYEVKADLNEEEFRTLSKAKVNIVQPGIESLATSTLKLMKKGTSAFQNILFLKNCLTYNIQPQWNLLVGFPGEGEEVYKKYIRDIPLLTHLPPPDGVFPVRFDRYSPYFTRAKEYGLDLRPVDYYKFIYPFSDASLSQLAYYFADQNFNASYLSTMVQWIEKVRAKFAVWEELWEKAKSVGSRPGLYFKRNGADTVVYDSRSGKAVEHILTDLGAQLLELLNKPKKKTDIFFELKDIPQLILENEIASHLEKGLIFEEGDRFLNLALPENAAV